MAALSISFDLEGFGDDFQIWDGFGQVWGGFGMVWGRILGRFDAEFLVFVAALSLWLSFPGSLNMARRNARSD